MKSVEEVQEITVDSGAAQKVWPINKKGEIEGRGEVGRGKR